MSVANWASVAVGGLPGRAFLMAVAAAGLARDFRTGFLAGAQNAWAQLSRGQRR